MKTLLFALLFVAPALAHADVVYKCKSVNFSDQLSANLRFAENGRSGSVEVEFWNGYPPISLVSAELKAPVKKGAFVLFESEVDSLRRNSAELKLPADFLDSDFFQASIATAKGEKPYFYGCNRF